MAAWPTFHAVLHVLQVAQGNPHQAGGKHQLVLVRWPHELRGQVDEEYASVARGDLVVAYPGVSEAADHHLVSAVEENVAVDFGLALQVAPYPHLFPRPQMKDSMMSISSHTHITFHFILITAQYFSMLL